MTYNLTNLTSATNPAQLVGFVNEVTGQSFMSLMVLAFFIIMLVKLFKLDFASSLALSSYLAFVLSSVMVFAEWINLMIPLAFLTLAALSTFYLYATK